jgi:hypothetical protein
MSDAGTGQMVATALPRGGGGPSVLLVDPFAAEPGSITPADSGHVVRARVPHALTVSKV